MKQDTAHVSKLVDHLFRRLSAQMVATLTRAFGVQHLELAEDVVQETLLKALNVWSFSGVPENPEGWLVRSARNLALDHLRRRKTFGGKAEEIARYVLSTIPDDDTSNVQFRRELSDDLLGMMFVCCHPSLSRNAQVALTLRTLGGLGVHEIARAFLVSNVTISQRLVRAKLKLREVQAGDTLSVSVPVGEELARRLDAVLEVLYLMFNEGYHTHAGENLVRHELCEEAARQGGMLLGYPACALPKVHALQALFLLQMARLPARLDQHGCLMTLKEQDRSRWDKRLIQLGHAHLSHASTGPDISEYHLQAAIAAVHAGSPDFASTNWSRIVELYDHLIELNSSAVFKLNRAVAAAQVDGYAEALCELESLADEATMHGYHLYFATLADFHLNLGNWEMAEQYYQTSRSLTASDVEREFLERKMKQISHKRSC